MQVEDIVNLSLSLDLELPGEEWRSPLISGLQSYQASNYGRVKRLNRYGVEQICKQNVESGYRYINQDTVNVKWRVHRLIAAAFIPIPDYIPEVIFNARDGIPFQINHINAVKQYNVPSNLEWCPPKVNINHAMDNNLYGRNNNVRLIDVVDDLSMDYISMKHLARALDVDPHQITKFLDSKLELLLLDRYRIQTIDPNRLDKNININSVPVIVHDAVTGYDVVVDTLTAAARITAVGVDAIRARIYNNDDRLTSGYVFREYKTETARQWPNVSKRDAELSRTIYEKAKKEGKNTCSSKPVEVYDVNTKTLTRYHSLRDAVAFHGDDYTRTSKLINHKGPKLYRFNGKVYRLIGDKRSLTDTDLYISKVGYIAKNYITGEIELFDANPDVRAKFNDYPDNIFRAQNPKTSPRRLVKGWWLQTQNESGEYVWPEFTDDEIKASVTYKQYPSFIGRNYETGEIRIFKSAADIREMFGKAPNDLLGYMNHPKFPIRLVKGWYVKKEGDVEEWPKILGF